MKNFYENAEMDVVVLGAEDIITTSPGGGNADTSSTSHYNPSCENEGPAGDAFL